MQTAMIAIIAVVIGALALMFRRQISDTAGAVGEAVEDVQQFASATINVVDDVLTETINGVIYHPEDNNEAINLLVNNGITAEKWLVWHEAAKAGILTGFAGRLFDEKLDGMAFFNGKMKVIAGMLEWDDLHTWLFQQVQTISHYTEDE
jgi:hypothetical protein